MTGLLLLRAIVIAAGLALAYAPWAHARRMARAGERRTAVMSRRWAAAIAGCYALLGAAPAAALPYAGAVALAAPLALALAYRSGTRPRAASAEPTPVRRHDERDVIFVRCKLQPATARYEEYYRRRPELQEADDRFRAYPGLLGLSSTFYDPYLFATGRALLETVYYGLNHFVDGPPFARGVNPDPASVSAYLKQLGRHLGALEIGIAPLRGYHVYTHGGYGDAYGEPVHLPHRFAIALTVEMDRDISAGAPRAGVWLEIGHHYLTAATISVVLAAAIRQLGFPARAHVIDNFTVVGPLVARDAGLGEIGRMSILMSPTAGPRVRIGVITTDLELVPDAPIAAGGMADFCTRCTKCADACPADAIPFGPAGDEDGLARWKIDHEACFTYWRKTGVPCGRCLAVCPFSSSDTLVDRLIKRGARGAAPWQALALAAHDHLYGKKPRPLPPPAWMHVDGRAPGGPPPGPATR